MKAIGYRDTRISRRTRSSFVVSFLLLSALAIAVTTADPLLRGAHIISDASSLTNTTTDKSSLNIPPALWILPLHANSGTHHLTIHVGQPLQRRTLIVDTGSRLTAWVCDECVECGKHANAAYVVGNSSTAVVHACGQCDWPDTSTSSVAGTTSRCRQSHQQQLQQQRRGVHTNSSPKYRGDTDAASRCVMRQQYTEGSSWTAHEVNDVVVLEVHAAQVAANATSNATNDTTTAAAADNWHANILETTFPFTFFCQTVVHALFRLQYADGILGLEMTEKSLVHQLHAAKLLPEPIFSLCLTRHAGYLGLGGAASLLLSASARNSETQEQQHQQPVMRFTPLASPSTSSGWYSVTVQQVWLRNANQTVTVAAKGSAETAAFASGKGTILDSGTTDTYLPAKLAKAFHEAWTRMTGYNFVKHRAHRYTFDQFQALPDILLHLANNVTLTVSAANYMEGLPDDYAPSTTNSNPNPAWLGTRELTNRIYVNEPVGAVLGLNAMIGYDMLYDSVRGRVGFVPSDCRPE